MMMVMFSHMQPIHCSIFSSIWSRCVVACGCGFKCKHADMAMKYCMQFAVNGNRTEWTGQLDACGADENKNHQDRIDTILSRYEQLKPKGKRRSRCRAEKLRKPVPIQFPLSVWLHSYWIRNSHSHQSKAKYSCTVNLHIMSFRSTPFTVYECASVPGTQTGTVAHAHATLESNPTEFAEF